jgi:hypothetical protein
LEVYYKQERKPTRAVQEGIAEALGLTFKNVKVSGDELRYSYN